MKTSVRTFDGLDHQYTLGKLLHQTDTHMIFTMGEQPLHLAAVNQKHSGKMAYIQCSLSGIASGWFLRLHESYKNDWSAFVSAFKKQFVSLKNACLTSIYRYRTFHFISNYG